MPTDKTIHSMPSESGTQSDVQRVLKRLSVTVDIIKQLPNEGAL